MPGDGPVSQTERIHQIVRLLETSRHPVPIARFLDELEVSRATFKRDIAYLRDRLGAPVVWRRGSQDTRAGYQLGDTADVRDRSFTLPGLWFNQSEIHALLRMYQLAGSMQPGLVGEQARSLMARITQLLDSSEDDPRAILSYIEIRQSATRRQPSEWFELVARATVRRKRLDISYFTRSRDEVSTRQVSPQRLLHYRENWYLLGWCHRVDGLRLFALDALRDVSDTGRPARTVARKHLEESLGSGFGIFGGKADKTAVLRFSDEAARWIATEAWHPRQRVHHEGGRLILEVPYSQSRELAMEILRHGPDVEVLAPASLRQLIDELLRKTLRQYDSRS